MNFFTAIMFLIGGVSQVHSHGTEVRQCLTATGMRIFVEHWHGDDVRASGGNRHLKHAKNVRAKSGNRRHKKGENDFEYSGTMTIRADHVTGAPSTQLNPDGHVLNTAPGSLPGCRSGESDTLVTSCGWINNNWVYYDFPITCAVPVDYTLLSGQTVVLEEGCDQLYPARITGTFACSPPTEAPTIPPTSEPTNVPTKDHSTVPSSVPSNWHHDYVNLGTAGNFAILTKSGVTTTGVTSVTGHIGTSPIVETALTGFALERAVGGTHSTSSMVTGFVYSANHGVPTPSMMTTAVNDMDAAYIDASGRVGPGLQVEVGAGILSGLTLVPGIYKWSTNVDFTTNFIFEGTSTDVWIMQIAGTFTSGPGAKIILAGEAKAENIYWAIADVVVFDDGSHGEDIFLTKPMISFKAGISLYRAAFAQTAVTMISTSIIGALVPSPFP